MSHDMVGRTRSGALPKDGDTTRGGPHMHVQVRRTVIAAVLAALAAAAGVTTALAANAATSGCRVTYAISSQWQGGFGANVSVTDLGDPLAGWTLTWSFAAGQQV